MKTTNMPSAAERPIAAVLGGRGMLGGDLVRFLGRNYKIVSIDRKNYERHKGESFDVFINANGNSRRFWADRNPLEDFEASTHSVYKTFVDFVFERYVYVSSSDVYPDHSNPDAANEKTAIAPELLQPYGFHKYLSEKIVANRSRNFLILRCSMMLGENLKKGPVYDILHGKPLFVAKGSRIQMITTQEIARVVDELLKRGARNEIYNVGGQGTVDFQTIGAYFGKDIAVAGGAEHQIYEMAISKLASFYRLKTSEEYLREFLAARSQ